MSVSFGGIGEIAATFMTSGTIKAGDTVKMAASGTVTACAAGERFCGVVLGGESGGHAAVQVGGYVKLPYTGSAPTVGYGCLEAAGDGKVQVDADGTSEVLIVDVDTAAETVGFFM